MKFIANPKKILFLFLLVILFLLAANILGLIMRLYFGHSSVYGLVPLFDFNVDTNIPTLYSAVALVITCSLLAIIALIHRSLGNPYFSWVCLALVFLFLAIDESALIHERLVSPVKGSLNPSGIFAAAWVIPYAFLVIIFVLSFLKFLLRLPSPTKQLFVFSGAIFVTGAMGFEMLGQWHYEIHQQNNLIFSVIYTFEELFEMLGVVIFIYALLAYMTNQFDQVTITMIGPSDRKAAGGADKSLFDFLSFQ